MDGAAGGAGNSRNGSTPHTRNCDVPAPFPMASHPRTLADGQSFRPYGFWLPGHGRRRLCLVSTRAWDTGYGAYLLAESDPVALNQPDSRQARCASGIAACCSWFASGTLDSAYTVLGICRRGFVDAEQNDCALSDGHEHRRGFGGVCNRCALAPADASADSQAC